jgi:polyisoprenoid-binding protein YceI
MKKLSFVWVLFHLCIVAHSQVRFYAERSHVTFFSDGIIEDITAENKNVTSIFDVRKGEIAFLIKVKDFQFEKKLMQVHFNEKYLESEKFPKSTFVGTLKGFDITKEGVQNVTASGRLSIHGVNKEMSMPGTLEVKGRNIVMKSKFKVKLADFNITIPQVVWQNISEEVEISVNFTYSPL